MKKIKNIKNIMVILLLCWLSQACSEFLNVDIPDVLPDKDFWKTRAQVEAARNGVYTQLGNCITNFIVWGDVRSDLYATGNASTSDRSQLINQDILTSNGYAYWSNVYTTINYANSFIRNARRVLAFDETMEEDVEYMIGEMYGIRALCYFYLVRTFNDVPVHLEPYESDKQEVNVPASPESQVLDTIEADLRTALRLAPDSYETAKDNYGRVTKKAVRAIWADVKLWRGDYDGCIGLCEELETEYQDKLVKTDNWFSIFGAGNSTESIFEYQYSSDGVASPLSYFATFYYTSLGNGSFAGNYKAYRRNMQKVYAGSGMRTFSDTVRTNGTTVGNYSSNGRLDVYKYQGIAAGYEEFLYRDDMTKFDAHFIFYRFREILLIKAEALAMQGEFEKAIEPINVIREATGLETTNLAKFGSGETFFDKLLSERCAELAYEGKQWFSLVRIALHTGYTNLLVDRIAETHLDLTSAVVKSRLQDVEGWFMPYLKTEVERNHSLEQKKYYRGKE